MFRFISFVTAAFFSAQISALAAVTIEPWVPIFKGIEYARGEADTNEVRLQKVFAFRIGLQDATIEMFSTPGGGSKETLGQTTTTFVGSYGVKVGVNANFFSPVSTTPNEPRDLSGLAISRGQIVSPVETIRRMLLVTSNNVASIVEGNFVFNPADYWTAVAGSDRVLIGGVVQTFASSDFTTGNHPRTAVGISQDGRFLVMLVIDGRQPTWSDGAPLTDVGEWLVRFGCHEGLNLDGGGSTTMVKAQSGGPVILNKPSGGVQRVNGNHLGAFSQDMAPVFVNPPQNTTILQGSNLTLSALAGGTTPLRFQWQFSGTNIAGATNSALTISNATFAHTGTYTLSVSNHVGLIAESITLEVNYGLFTSAGLGGVISKSPDTANHAPDSSVTLTAVPDPGFVFTGWSGDVESASNPVLLTMAGHKTVTATFSGFPSDIIVDNPQATFAGTWSTATIAADKYGTNYRTASTIGTKTATYRPMIYTPGRYAVYIWYPTELSRAINAPWTVFFNGGSQLTLVDQNLNGGRWNLIGAGGDFLRGTNGSVSLSNTNSARVIADAVKFVYGFAPEITAQPQDVTVVSGAPAILGVTISGTAPLTYQWFQNGTPLSGATNSSFSIANAASENAGLYTALVTNLFGSVTTRSAELVVNVPPTISTQPQSQSVAQATDVTFSVSAQGTAPLNYLWHWNGTPLPHATASSLTVTNAQTSQAGDYFVRVTNVAGMIFSSNATLTVSSMPVGPTIAQQPLSQIAIAGQNPVLEARANGTLPLFYQWKFNGFDLPGETGSSLTISNIQPANTGSYSVRVTNEVSSTSSAGAMVTVHFSLTTIAELGGVITKSPPQNSYAPGSSISLSAVPDSNFTFSGWQGAAASTNNPLSFTIQSNSTLTAKFTGSVTGIIMDNPAAVYLGTWTIGTTAAGRYGNDYHFAGTSSSEVTATATYRPNITTPGKYHVYIWYPQGSNRASNAPWEIVSENETRLTLVDQMTGGGSWQLISTAHDFTRGTNGFVRLSNTANNNVVIADAVRWGFIIPPKFNFGPTNLVVPVGANVVFSSSAAGAAPISYRWYFNEAPIPGATGSSYGLSSAQLSHSGSYSVAASNAADVVFSAPALLTVVPSPVPLYFDAITVLTNGLRISLKSETNLSFMIEGSTNLTHWIVLTNFSNQIGPVEFTDSFGSAGKQFYRARISN